MKSVFFCGGYGMRLYPDTENIPKPLVVVGDYPIIYNLMKSYDYYGHKDFVLCLGYKGNEIKKYFLEFNDAISCDFVMKPSSSDENERIEVLNRNMVDWKITFADTGLNSNIGERLLKVRKYLEDEDMFFANYADALSTINLNTLIQYAKKKDKIGCFIAVQPPSSFHLVDFDEQGFVKNLDMLGRSSLRINGGWFVFKKEIFDYINEGEELVVEPFQRLIEEKQLVVYPFDGFWASMDTYKDKSRLDDMAAKGNAIWEVWKGDIKGR
jgi:glucose-1-phosphate cytidylyltransferase